MMACAACCVRSRAVSPPSEAARTDTARGPLAGAVPRGSAASARRAARLAAVAALRRDRPGRAGRPAGRRPGQRGAGGAAGARPRTATPRRRRTLESWLHDGTYGVDDTAALYVYEMRDAAGAATRGLLGAVELRDPADGVILPHENTMAGPVADRLAVMTATDADLEPIYLVYDGGGAASQLVPGHGRPGAGGAGHDAGRAHPPALDRDRPGGAPGGARRPRRPARADRRRPPPLCDVPRAATPRSRERGGPGPWDRGLALLVDTSDYGPQVHAIHRVVPGLALDDAVARLAGRAAAERHRRRPGPALVETPSTGSPS